MYIRVILLLVLFALFNQCVLSQDENIYGGTAAVSAQFPFMVHFWDETQEYHFCGGSLIGPYHILTAAHCLKGSNILHISIRSGTINHLNSPGDLVPAVSKIIHPQYDEVLTKNDLGVVKLSRPFKPSSNTRTIKMATTAIATGTSTTVAGWGETEEYYYSDDLLYTKAPTISGDACRVYYPEVDDASQICVFKTGFDACFGDSGGPLFTGTKTTAVEYGLVSYGEGCGEKPGVYTRVSNYHSWIVAQTVHTVSTACSGCTTSTNWKALCQSIGGTYAKISSAYQCRNLDVLKTRTVNFSWTGCTAKEQDLCQKIGRYSCVNGKGVCAAL